MKKLSLRNRILLYFLIVPFSAFISAGVLTIIDMRELQNFAAKTGADVANEASQESISALQREVRAELQMLAEGQATICELQMRRVVAGMKDLISLYTEIYSGNYSFNDKGFVSGGTYDQSFSDDFTYINRPGRHNEAETKCVMDDEVKKIMMMRNAFKYSCAYNDYYVGMGIALPCGLFFKYDWFPVPLNFDVRKASWFKRAMAGKGKLIWLDPTLSSVSNKLLLTCAQAVVVDDKIVALITIDVSPQTISKEFVITRGTGCFAFLVSPSGEIIAREDIITKKLIWKLSTEEKTALQNALMNKITISKKTSFTTTFKGKRMDVAFSPMYPGTWGIGIAAPVHYIHTAVKRAVGEIGERKNVYVLSIRRYIDNRILIYLGTGLLASVIMLLFATWAARHIGKPIKQLEAGVKLLGERKLNEKIVIKSNDEFQDLGEAFNAMASELDKQIATLKENIAHQEHARHEMLVAAEIQSSMLPDASLAFPKHDEFDIYAEMHPAKEVGGDFYDFFLVDEKHLFFSIGDISGKGLPAALFMMRALTLLRHEAEDGFAPDEIFVNVGNELEHNNDSCMFFTGTCGLLDVNSGEIILSSAGHPPPYLRHGNSFEAVETKSGMIVGALPLKREQFSITKLQLRKGDTLFLYTDGVTEAFNSKLVEYQAERLHAVLQKLTGANPREILDGVAKSVAEFRGDAPQSDDITMLTIKYYA